jgi:flotillin
MEIEAEAMYNVKDQEALAKERTAEAEFVARQKEAAGLTKMSLAHGALSDVLVGGSSGLMQYMVLRNGTYQQLADANARAIHGLQPKINIWNTGAQDGSADPIAPIRNLFQCLPPMLSTITDRTGMTAPSWLARMPKQDAGNNLQVATKDMRADSVVSPMTKGDGH